MGNLQGWWEEGDPVLSLLRLGALLPRCAEAAHFLDLYTDMLGTFQEASEEGFCQPAREAQEAVM